MAIRRRRKTLTNLLSTMERRVTKVELRPINLLTTSQVAGATASEDETLDPGPDSVVSLNAPNQYKPIVDGYFYSSNVTGGKPLVELYFESNPGLEKDNTIRISGVNKLRHNSTAVAFDISKDYKTIAIDTEPYTGRASYGGERHTPPSTVDSTAMFNVSTGLTYGDRKQLIVSRRISTVEATTTTAKIVFTLPNYFEEGQIVYVGMPSDSFYYGIDGLFRVKEAGSNYITFDFDTALSEPINVANVTEERYVYAVAQSAIRDGATWFDSSQDPDVAYVWDDYRWVLFGSSTVTKDTKKPADVENLSASDENDTPPGSSTGQSRITLTWNAPTTNADGSPLDDLIGYTIWSRQYNRGVWDKVDITGLETEWAKSGFIQGQPAYFKVFARDSGGNLSEGVDLTHTTGVFAPEVAKPKAPTVTTYLGTIKIAYDDLTAFGLLQSDSAAEIEVYFSDVSGFTPGPTNYYGKFPANRGSYIIIPGTELVQNQPLQDGTDYYVKIKVRDIYGNVTEASEQVSVRVKLSNIVTFDMIDVGTLTGQVIIGLDIRTSSNPTQPGQGGIIMNQQGLTAYDKNGTQTFSINAGNGSVSIGSYLGRTEANETFLSVASADLRYATITRADGIALVAGDAKDVAEAAQDGVDAVRNNLDAVTEIEPGTIRVTLKRSEAIKSLNRGKSTSTTEIHGGIIRTGTLLADQIGAGDLPVGVIYAGSINASQVNAGVLTGRRVQTASSGQRAVLQTGSFNRLELHNPNGTLDGYVSSTVNGAFFGSEVSPGYVRLNVGGSSLNANASYRMTITTDGDFSVSQPRRSSGGNASIGSISGINAKAYVFTDLGGNLFASTSTAGVSDSRVKTNITESPLGIELINKLRPVQFDWADLAESDIEEHRLHKQYGFVAQDVKSALEELGVDHAIVVGEPNSKSWSEAYPDSDISDDNPLLTLDQIQLIPALVKSIQQLSDRIRILETQNQDIEDSNNG